MNTLTVSAPALMPSARLLRAYWIETRFELVKMLRSAAFTLPFLAIPLAAYLLFGVAIAGEAIAKDPQLADYLFSGFSVLAISGPALFGVGCTLAHERDAGLLQLKRAQPAPAGSWLVAKMVVSVVFGALAYLPILAAGIAIGKLTVTPAELAAMSVVLILGVLPFSAVGLLVGTLASGSAAPAWTNLIYLPMLWLSGMFIPLPAFLHGQTIIWPAFHLNQIALAAGGVEKFKFIPPQLAVAVLMGITTVCAVFALWRLRRRG